MTTPDMRRPEALWAHMRHTLAFYAPRARDETGGCFQFFKDDGTVYDRRTRHLVSSTRFVFNHALAWRWFGGSVDDVARDGLERRVPLTREQAASFDRWCWDGFDQSLLARVGTF